MSGSQAATRDHGGDLNRAIAEYGGRREDWLDLSTGVNAHPYPFAPPPPAAFARLPDQGDLDALLRAAAVHYRLAAAASLCAAPGAQALIQLLPRLRAPGEVRIVSPTYNEHAAAFEAAGWRVTPVADLEATRGAEAAVVVNPNNPDGRAWRPAAVRAAAASTGLMIVDESFVDADPTVSTAPSLGAPGLVALRSFGKFFGLAGVRLGFALGAAEEVGALAAMLGPWAVSGPALAIGAQALADLDWAAAERERAAARAARFDAMAAGAGWRLVGGAALFRTVDVGDARATQARLARARVWTRRFPYSERWLRFGTPDDERGWAQLAAALR